MFYNPYVHVLGLYTFLIYKSNMCQGIAFLKHIWRKLKTTKEIKEKRKSQRIKGEENSAPSQKRNVQHI